MRIPTRTPMYFASAPWRHPLPTRRRPQHGVLDLRTRRRHSVTCSTFWRTVDPLDSIDAIQIRETPQRNYIAINPDRLQKCDPILAIPQSEFYAPIQAFVDRVEATIADARQSIL